MQVISLVKKETAPSHAYGTHVDSVGPAMQRSSSFEERTGTGVFFFAGKKKTCRVMSFSIQCLGIVHGIIGLARRP